MQVPFSLQPDLRRPVKGYGCCVRFCRRRGITCDIEVKVEVVSACSAR